MSIKKLWWFNYQIHYSAVIIISVMILFPGAGSASIIIQPALIDGNDAMISGVAPSANAGPSEVLVVQPHEVLPGVNSLLKFNLNSIPSESDIVSASLHVYCSRSREAIPLDVHRITKSWQEDTVTWTFQNSLTEWSNPGGDYGIHVVDQQLSHSGWIIWDVSSLVQSWKDGLIDNNGFLIKSVSKSASLVELYSSEYNLDPGLRPKLEIEIETYDVLHIINNPMVPGLVSGGDTNVIMQELVLSVSGSQDGQVTIGDIAIEYTGEDITDIALDGIKIYDDVNRNSKVDSGLDILLGIGSFLDRLAPIDILDKLITQTNTEHLLICFDIALDAVTGHSVSSVIKDKTHIGIYAPDQIEDFTNFVSDVSIINFGGTISTPTVFPKDTPTPNPDPTPTATGRIITKLQPGAADGNDTYLSEDNVLLNFSSAEEVVIGNEFGAHRNNMLLSFDSTELCYGADVMQATLRMYCSENFVNGEVSAHRIVQNWTESGANWNTYDGMNSWMMPGGDFDTMSINQQLVTGSGWVTWDITDYVQDIVDGSFDNLGLLLQGDKFSGGSHSFYSSDYGDPALRPELDIIWESRYALASRCFDKAPSNVLGGQNNVVMGQLILTNYNDTLDVSVTDITVTFEGDNYSDIAADGVKIYDDFNDNGDYEPGVDILLGSGTFTDSYLTIDISDIIIIYGMPESLLLCYDIIPAAVPGNRVKAIIAAPLNITAANPACVMHFDSLDTGTSLITDPIVPISTTTCGLWLLLTFTIFIARKMGTGAI